MGDEERRKLFKAVPSISSIKNKLRAFSLDSRRDRREKVVSSKRFRGNSPQSTVDIPLGNTDYNSITIKKLAKLIQKKSGGTHVQLKYLREAFSFTSDFVDDFLEVDNSLYSLVGYLTGNDSTLQLEAAWCITNISANDHKNMLVVVKAVAVYLITYLQGGSELLQDQSAWALGNMAADSSEVREILKAQGIVGPLINLVKSSNANGVVQSSLFALCNMSRSLELVFMDLMQSDFLDILLQKLANDNTDLNVIGELAWLLTYLLSLENNCDVMASKGFITYLVHWLCKVRPHQKEYLFAITPLLRCLGNIIGCNDNKYIEAVISAESSILLHTLSNFLVSNKRYLIRECLWVISNIFACDMNLELYIDDVKLLLPNITRHLSSAYEIKIEAAISIFNLVNHGQPFFDLAVNDCLIKSFIEILKIPDSDIMFLSLQFFEMILSKFKEGIHLFIECDGPSYLEALEYHENEDIRNKAIYLIETYYENDDINDTVPSDLKNNLL